MLKFVDEDVKYKCEN